MAKVEYSSKTAVLSSCGYYRFVLTRRWADMVLPGLESDRSWAKHVQSWDTVNFIGINPSTADASKDDPTIRRCVGFARLWGFQSITMTNLFAIRSSKRTVIKTATNPIGDGNNEQIVDAAQAAGLVIAAWGAFTNSIIEKRKAEVLQLLKSNGIHLAHLGITSNGSPWHPLFVPYSKQPEYYDS